MKINYLAAVLLGVFLLLISLGSANAAVTYSYVGNMIDLLVTLCQVIIQQAVGLLFS